MTCVHQHDIIQAFTFTSLAEGTEHKHDTAGAPQQLPALPPHAPLSGLENPRQAAEMRTGNHHGCEPLFRRPGRLGFVQGLPSAMPHNVLF